MKIIRNGQEFELTAEELQQAYDEYQIEVIFGANVREKLQEDFDIDPDKDDIDWEQIAIDAIDLFEDDGYYYGSYWQSIEEAIDQYLEETEEE